MNIFENDKNMEINRVAAASGKRPVAKYHLVVANPQDTVSEIIEFIAVHDHKYCLLPLSDLMY